MIPWISFITFIIIVAFTPGPNNIMSMNNAVNVGFKKGMKFNYGIFFGFIVVMILCLVFSSVLYSMIPKIQFPMKVLGAAYMVYLIIKTLVPSKKDETKNKGGSFIVGALLQLINPKIMIYGITAMSSFILPYYNDIPMLLFFAFLLAFVGFVGTVFWALFGALFSKLFSTYGKLINVIMSVLLLYCIVSLFI